jgi:hypothetical protein
MVAGALINRGDPQAARSYLDRSLALARRLGDPATLQLALLNSGYGAICTNDLERARTEVEEALTVSTELDDPSAMVGTLHVLAWHANLCGERDRAADLLHEAVGLLPQDGRHSHHVDVITEAAVTVGQSQPAAAARLLGAADAGCESVGMRRTRPMAERVATLRQELEHSLGDTAMDGLAQGAGTSLQDAREEALAALAELTSQARVRAR